jgi:hypothetical protein
MGTHETALIQLSCCFTHIFFVRSIIFTLMAHSNVAAFFFFNYVSTFNFFLSVAKQNYVINLNEWS